MGKNESTSIDREIPLPSIFFNSSLPDCYFFKYFDQNPNRFEFNGNFKRLNWRIFWERGLPDN
ncbi:hypothetical protein EFY79_06455 [Hanamia caeni]|uniref:Uncharacterized protein n=1 Tax=Hanamia caeni TaxID=2294116 RepID=A0A3M9NJB5_9BACT|nr:hypothetical protein EFY79_06455 [Hanamia caeni]